MIPADAPTKFYVYAIVETATTPPTLVDVRFSRREAREFAETPIRHTPTLRIRRAKLTLFES